MKHVLHTKGNRLRAITLVAFMLLMISNIHANRTRIITDGSDSQTLTLNSKCSDLSKEASSKTAIEALKNTKCAAATSEDCAPFPPSIEDVAAAFPAMMPTIGLISPCLCRENAPNSNGNATTLTNGQFIDTVQVSSITGETWMLISATGFHDINSPQPPAAPADYPVNTLLSESTPGSGLYQIAGVHVDDIGYTISVSNGIDTLTIANTCVYPNPEIINLRTGYCTNSSAVPLEADNQGLIGTGTFDILDASTGANIQSNAADFSGQELGDGAWLVRYTFTETGGCTQTVEQLVDVVPPFGSLFCNSNVQISFDGNCEIVVTPDMILEGSYPSFGIFDVEIFDGVNALGNTISADYEGETLTTKIINTCSGNFCWGNITASDYMPPVFDCPIDTTTLVCTDNPTAVPAPTATDNCEGNITPALMDEDIDNFDCTPNGLVQRIVRTYTAFDSKGNEATPCVQVIEIERADINDVLIPADVEFACGSNPNTNPENTGLPTINGLDIFEGGLCNIATSFSDDTLMTCGVSYKIIRTWTAIDWCSPSSVGVNPIIEEQVIGVTDTTAPSISAPDTIVVSINQDGCTASFLLPNPIVTDICSTFEVEVFTPVGVIEDIENQQVTGLTINTYTLVYQATDECGNVAQRNLTVIVEDQAAPIMVCDEITDVTLNTNGEAEVFATTFDDGSYDYCTNLSFLVRRMDEGIYAESVLFDCDDAGQTVMVELQGTDFFGVTNSCMVEVNVEDKNAPIVTCPDDITIDCTQDFSDLDVTGVVEAFEPCGFAVASSNDLVVNINSCGVGFVQRVFTYTDLNDNTSTCDQLIIIENPNFFTEVDITWPQDYAAPDCTDPETLTIDGLPAGFDRPVINQVACAQIATAVEEELFDMVAPACFRIRRTWTIIDWCQYDVNDPNSGGIYTYVQEIEVTDNTPPVIHGCPLSPFMKIINPVCDTAVILPIPDSITDCSPEITISAISDLGIGLGPFPGTLPGFYDVTITATDGCGNLSTCFYVLQVSDGKAPTPYCQNLATVIMPMGGMVEVSAEMFNVGSFDNCTAPEDLVYSFTNDPTEGIQQFTCDDFIGGPIEVEMHVFDEEFNEDFCIVTLDLQDPNGICDNERTIAGTISTEMGDGVADVNVIYSGMGGGSMMTQNDGMYSFQLTENEDYTIVPEKDINLLNGVTTYDLVKISRHILGTEPLTSPYKIIAADVNHNNAVTTADIVALKQVILQVSDEFPNNTSWRFVDAGHIFLNENNPFETDFPEFFSINNLPEDILDVDFVAVKIGDVNNTVSASELTTEIENRTIENLIFSIDNQELIANEEVTVYFEAADFKNIEGYQFSLQFDTEALSFLGLEESEYVKESDFGWNDIADGKIITSWYNSGKNIDNSKFGLKFAVHKSVSLKNALQLNQYDKIFPEAYKRSNGTISHLNIQFQFNESRAIENEIQLYQNQPNPFSQRTWVPFQTLVSKDITLEVLDSSGRMLYSKQATFEAGEHAFELNRAIFPSSGIYFYRLKTNTKTMVKRMIIE